jgi:hypothetical protein
MSTTGHDIPELDRDGLRRFGLTTGAIIAGLFGLLIPWILGARFPIWPWLVFGVLGMWAILHPLSLRSVYLGWMRFGLLLSKITTPIVIGAVFFVLIAPIALVLRAVRWDPLARKFDDVAETYRVQSEQPQADNLEKPF